MLQPRKNQWDDYYTHHTKGYFGKNSIPLHVQDNIYQLKCLIPEHETSKTVNIKTLQFEIGSKPWITLERIQSLSDHHYFRTCYLSYYETDNSNVGIVYELYEPMVATPTAKCWDFYHKLFNRLHNMKPLTKPVLK